MNLTGTFDAVCDRGVDTFHTADLRFPVRDTETVGQRVGKRSAIIEVRSDDIRVFEGGGIFQCSIGQVEVVSDAFTDHTSGGDSRFFTGGPPEIPCKIPELFTGPETSVPGNIDVGFVLAGNCIKVDSGVFPDVLNIFDEKIGIALIA